MTVDEKPYWLQRPRGEVLRRLELVRNLASATVRTVRRITYLLYPKTKGKELEKRYNTTIKDVVRARILGIIPWKNIREVRCKFTEPKGRKDMKEFLEKAEVVKKLGDQYFRDRRPAHKRKFLVWFEAQAVEEEFEDVCYTYDVPYVCGRGQATWSIKNKMATEKLDGEWLILYFGDNDEKGHEIYDVIKRDLKYRGCAAKMEWVAVTPEIEEEYNLPEGSRIDGFELEDLKNLIENIIIEYIDIEKYNEIIETEQRERDILNKNYKLVIRRKSGRG